MKAFKLVSGMEDEVVKKYRIRENHWCKIQRQEQASSVGLQEDHASGTQKRRAVKGKSA